MTFTRILAAALVTVAVAAAPASAKPIDPIGTGGPATTSPSDDLRAPDNREAVVTTQSPVPGDLRTPDAVDAGLGRGTADVTVVEVPQRSVTSSGIEWEDAGLGAAIVLGLGLLGLGGFAVAHRRHGSAIAG